MVEKECEWLLPENFKEMERLQKASAQSGAIKEGLFTSYYLCRLHDDFNFAKNYCLSEERADEYVKNLQAFLRRIGRRLSGNIIDIGCAVGTISNAIDKVNVDGQTAGLDFSVDAIEYARKHYSRVKWYAKSADDLSNFADNSFDFIHVREFYPLDRTNDTEHHLQYLKTFHAKLKSGGALLLDLRNLKKCFSNTYKILTPNLAEIGYLPVIRKQVVRHAFFRLFGEMAYRIAPLNIVLTVITTLTGWLTKMKPNYFYLFIKK